MFDRNAAPLFTARTWTELLTRLARGCRAPLTMSVNGRTVSVARNRVSSQYRFLAYSTYYIDASAFVRLTDSPGVQAPPLGVADSSKCLPHA